MALSTPRLTRKAYKITTPKLAAVGVVALLLAGGAWMAPNPKAEESPYRTATVSQGDITSSVSASGELEALVTIDVGSQISGQIKEILVDFNDRVRKGQVLAIIDPQTYTSRVKQGQAQVAASNAGRAQAQAQAAVAKANYDRTQSLFDKGFVAQAQLDADLAAYRASQASIASATAQIGESQAALVAEQVDLGRTTITAPIDGIVIDRKIEPGNTVAASLQAPPIRPGAPPSSTPSRPCGANSLFSDEAGDDVDAERQDRGVEQIGDGGVGGDQPAQLGRLHGGVGDLECRADAERQIDEVHIVLGRLTGEIEALAARIAKMAVGVVQHKHRLQQQP
jgi:multidrug efflux pump subunit AcrA (membrane-fusion protein)